MNGRKAKQLRREARESSTATEYNVQWYKQLVGKPGKDGKTIMNVRGTVTARGYRRVYQDSKQKT